MIRVVFNAVTNKNKNKQKPQKSPSSKVSSADAINHKINVYAYPHRDINTNIYTEQSRKISSEFFLVKLRIYYLLQEGRSSNNRHLSVRKWAQIFLLI